VWNDRLLGGRSSEGKGGPLREGNWDPCFGHGFATPLISTASDRRPGKTGHGGKGNLSARFDFNEQPAHRKKIASFVKTGNLLAGDSPSDCAGEPKLFSATRERSFFNRLAWWGSPKVGSFSKEPAKNQGHTFFLDLKSGDHPGPETCQPKSLLAGGPLPRNGRVFGREAR